MISGLGVGMSYFKTNTFYIMRIVANGPYAIDHNQFILGSITGDGGFPKTRNLGSDFITSLKSSAFDLKITADLTLKPMWVSNGMFFDQNYNNSDENPFVRRAQVMGPLVQNGGNYLTGVAGTVKDSIYNPPDNEEVLSLSKRTRWMFIQNLYKNGTTEWGFPHLKGTETSYQIRSGTTAPAVDFPVPQKAPHGKTGWDWAIGSAGCLIEQGESMVDEAGTGKNGAFNLDVQSKTGTVIAQNYNPDNPNLDVLYLLMPIIKIGWEPVANYLLDSGPNGFLKQINHPADGQILRAITYDGGSSRQIWVKGEDIDNNALPVSDSAIRQCPHYICLWGKPPK